MTLDVDPSDIEEQIEYTQYLRNKAADQSLHLEGMELVLAESDLRAQEARIEYYRELLEEITDD